VEVKIGIVESPRELVVSSDQTPEEVQKLVEASLGGGDALLKLVDDKGRTFLVRPDQIAYVEIAPAERRVGFGLA
jgi:hypothetical protein